MARIKIEDLPVEEDLSPTEMQGIFGGRPTSLYYSPRRFFIGRPQDSNSETQVPMMARSLSTIGQSQPTSSWRLPRYGMQPVDFENLRSSWEMWLSNFPKVGSV